MSKKIRTEAVDYLFNAILSLENKEECYTFFEDICTINELLSLSQRFEVAKMLREQKTYLEIAEKTGASTATISRVNRSLNYGNDGYDMVFERLSSNEKRDAYASLFFYIFFLSYFLGVFFPGSGSSSMIFSIRSFFTYTSKLKLQINEKSLR